MSDFEARMLALMARPDVDPASLAAGMREVAQRIEFAMVHGLEASLGDRPPSIPEAVWPEFCELMIEGLAARGGFSGQ